MGIPFATLQCMLFKIGCDSLSCRKASYQNKHVVVLFDGSAAAEKSNDEDYGSSYDEYDRRCQHLILHEVAVRHQIGHDYSSHNEYHQPRYLNTAQFCKEILYIGLTKYQFNLVNFIC